MVAAAPAVRRDPIGDIPRTRSRPATGSGPTLQGPWAKEREPPSVAGSTHVMFGSPASTTGGKTSIARPPSKHRCDSIGDERTDIALPVTAVTPAGRGKYRRFPFPTLSNWEPSL